MNQPEIKTKSKQVSDPAIGKGFVYICATTRELRRAASREGLSGWKLRKVKNHCIHIFVSSIYSVW